MPLLRSLPMVGFGRLHRQASCTTEAAAQVAGLPGGRVSEARGRAILLSVTADWQSMRAEPSSSWPTVSGFAAGHRRKEAGGDPRHRGAEAGRRHLRRELSNPQQASRHTLRRTRDSDSRGVTSSSSSSSLRGAGLDSGRALQPAECSRAAGPAGALSGPVSPRLTQLMRWAWGHATTQAWGLWIDGRRQPRGSSSCITTISSSTRLFKGLATRRRLWLRRSGGRNRLVLAPAVGKELAQVLCLSPMVRVTPGWGEVGRVGARATAREVWVAAAGALRAGQGAGRPHGARAGGHGQPPPLGPRNSTRRRRSSLPAAVPVIE